MLQQLGLPLLLSVRLDRVLSNRPPTPRALLVPLNVVRTLAMKLGLAGNNAAVRLDPSIRADDHLTEPPLITPDVHVLAEIDLRRRKTGRESGIRTRFQTSNTGLNRARSAI
jgi:hypothetical protein